MKKEEFKDNKKKLALEIHKKLKEDLDINKTSQRQFTDEFYLSYVNKNANDGELHDHYSRYKKSCKRNTEIPALYHIAYKYMYGELLTEDAKSAAWDFYIEISNRVTCKPLKEDQGSEVAALTSLHKIFDLWREICKKHGPNALDFLNYSENYMDNLRSFTTKWHCKIEGNDSIEEFREELKKLQIESNEFIEQLKERYFLS